MPSRASVPRLKLARAAGSGMSEVTAPRNVPAEAAQQLAPEGASASRSSSDLVEIVLPLALLIVCLAAAITVDPVRTSFGLKGDEATYTAMALSMAYDGDLVYERKDLDRFWANYLCGPDGIYLKKGKKLSDPEHGRGFRIQGQNGFPWLKVAKYGESPGDRLYFGKAYIYSVFGAPFVRLFGGLNGLLVFHVLILALVGWCGIAFIRARAPGRTAVAFTAAFFGASIVPVYLIWLTPELFNLSCVFVAYFLWLYKEVAPANDTTRWARFLRGQGSDVLAAVLLGIVIFSKPLNILLIGPPVLFLWFRRRWWRGLAMGTVCAGMIALLFTINLLVTGEFNYQGGNRKMFFGWFPLASSEVTFETARGGISAATNDGDSGTVFEQGVFLHRLGLNTYYFLVGRHSGFIPYFFPGVVVLALWLWRRREMQTWQVLAAAGAAASLLVVLVMMPYTWQGGGGPPGNRYFLNLYPVLFFLAPPMRGLKPALVAWIGGALFTAQAIVNPFYTSKYPFWNVDHGAVRMLPVELTTTMDLPVMLDRWRSQIPYGQNPTLSLFLLDENIYAPEPAGIWTVGERRGDLLIRTAKRLSSLRISVTTHIPNTVWLEFDGQSTEVTLKPGQAVDVVMSTTGGTLEQGHYSYLLSVKAAQGYVPFLRDPKSTDKRFLGALLKLQATEQK